METKEKKRKLLSEKEKLAKLKKMLAESSDVLPNGQTYGEFWRSIGYDFLADYFEGKTTNQKQSA